MKKIIAYIIIFSLFVTGCTASDQQKYHKFAEAAVEYLYGILGDNELFEIHSIHLYDDSKTGYLFYTIEFQSTYDSYTDEGIILVQATFLYIVESENPLRVAKFNINDSALHETLYSQYLSAMTSENYSYDFSVLEIEDMVHQASKQ